MESAQLFNEVLYDRILRVDPAWPDDPDRDRFLLSKGHGLGLGVGMALGLRSQGRSRSRVYVLVGDGELDEGSNHEAIHYAGVTGLDSLTVVVVDNHSSRHGWPNGPATLFTAHDWSGVTVNGRDHDALAEALRGHQPGRPHVVVADVPLGEA